MASVKYNSWKKVCTLANNFDFNMDNVEDVVKLFMLYENYIVSCKRNCCPDNRHVREMACEEAQQKCDELIDVYNMLTNCKKSTM